VQPTIHIQLPTSIPPPPLALPPQVRQAAAYVKQRNRQKDAAALQFEPAEVVRVQQVGMGDRACVDLCSLLVPGEGMLVGSFARALFLVHSECEESAYINSRWAVL
jgi:3-dehydroquinate synthase class II